MGAAALWALLGVLGLWVSVLILGPNRMFRGTLVERAHAVVTETLPALARRSLAQCGLGAAVAARVDGVLTALFGRRNPLLQIVAVGLYWAGLSIFLLQAAPHIPNRHVGAWHWVPICATLATNIVCYVAASAADPGVVGPDNAEAACRTFPYDRLLFFERTCATCRLPKPARSKHCPACQRCVQMAEHHCVWINNCVGLYNTRWFLGFLTTLGVICVYGAFLVATVVLEQRHLRGLAGPLLVWDAGAGRHVALTVWSSLLVTLGDCRALGMLLVLLAVLAPAIVVFAAYQLRIATLGYTGNEEGKWLNVAAAIRDGVVFAVREPGGAEAICVIEEEDQAADPRPRRPITHLRQVPNAYDRGPWGNLRLVLFPPRPAPSPQPEPKPHAA